VHVELAPVMDVHLHAAVAGVVRPGQEPWQVKLPLIQSPSLDLVLDFSLFSRCYRCICRVRPTGEQP
jgi:hypothetical protein